MFTRFLVLILCCCGVSATAFGVAPIAPLIADLSASDHETRQTARLALRQTLVDAPPRELAALEAELLQAIAPDRDWATRDWCLRLVELVGTPAAVNPLTSLLNDPDPRIRDLARRALASIPSRRAIDALRRGARQAPAGERDAYADALAYRGDDRAVKELIALLREGSADAALALGKVGHRSARSALQKAHATADDDDFKAAVEYALLDAGVTNRRLAATLAQSGQTPTVRIAAFGQLTDLDAPAAAAILRNVLAQPDHEQRAVFLRRAMESARLREDVVARLPDLPESDRIVVLDAIADLRLAKYEPVALSLLNDASETLQPVVARTLGVLGTDASFQPLLDRYLANSRDRAVTAALARLQAPSAERSLFATARGDGAVTDRVAALRLLVLRNAAGVVELLNAFTGAGHAPELRTEAFRGLEVVGDFGSVRTLLQVVLNDDPLKRPAQNSVKRLSANLGVPDPLWQDCYAPALAAAANDDRRRDVLAIIDGISGPAAAAWLQQIVMEEQPLRQEALEALGRWTDISGIDAWIEIARAEGATAEEIAAAKQSIVRIAGSTRTTGQYEERVQRAVKAMDAFPDDPVFRREMVANYEGKVHWQMQREIKRLFPKFLDDPAIAAEVKELLDR
ncbi:MAG TPA: HEAT repeat domain-containing protein [Candidatus Synoicihabitans sp.]|nr:HEAT repeat domain-containing protein [Candidatus Synoicihabitans sp.]